MIVFTTVLETSPRLTMHDSSAHDSPIHDLPPPLCFLNLVHNQIAGAGTRPHGTAVVDTVLKYQHKTTGVWGAGRSPSMVDYDALYTATHAAHLVRMHGVEEEGDGNPPTEKRQGGGGGGDRREGCHPHPPKNVYNH